MATDDEVIVDGDVDEIKKRWNCCPYCGASSRDASMCKNCLAFAGGEPLLLAAADVHAPSTKEKEWTLCGVWNPGSDEHPVYKQQKMATRAALITCPLCVGRIAEYRETGIPPRLRPL